MAANERDMRRVQELLEQGRPNLALLIALRPSLFQTAVMAAFILLIWVTL
jgi:hypothetical protein